MKEEKEDKYSPILMDMVRKMVPDLLANQLTAVQPMSDENGQVFSMGATSMVDKFIRDELGNLPKEVIIETLKEKYPEAFI